MRDHGRAQAVEFEHLGLDLVPGPPGHALGDHFESPLKGVGLLSLVRIPIDLPPTEKSAPNA